MLADNTNTLVWVGVAVGVVALIGGAALLLFPNLLSNVRTEIDKMITNFSAGENRDGSAISN